ncbi:methionine ABC transporter ATP-binding protein [Firmicutes bacterium i23-0019-B6]
MIIAENLCKNYGDLQVLKNIHLKIEDGDIYGLVGKSGVGKSTLLRCINGLETYQSGSLQVEGEEVSKKNGKALRLFRKQIGMVFQHFSLLERKSVRDNIALPMKCWGISGKESEKEVERLAKIVGLEDKLDVKARNLSGGQKQRVAIARALTLKPKILLCDEATSALDPKTTKDILKLLKKINQEMNITIVMVTHQMSVVREICNKVSILEKGRIVEEGDVASVFARYSKPLQNLLGETEITIPKDGVTLKIIIPDRKENDNLLSLIAINLGVPFSLVGGHIEQYREQKIGTFFIQIKKEYEERVKNYLKDKYVEYESV